MSEVDKILNTLAKITAKVENLNRGECVAVELYAKVLLERIQRKIERNE